MQPITTSAFDTSTITDSPSVSALEQPIATLLGNVTGGPPPVTSQSIATGKRITPDVQLTIAVLRTVLRTRAGLTAGDIAGVAIGVAAVLGLFAWW